MQERINKLEKRIEKLEGEGNDVVKVATEGLRLAKLTRLEGQETKAIVGRVELIQGDTNERLDTIERTLESYDKHFESVEQTQAAHTEVLDQLVTLSESHSARFDRIEQKLSGHDDRFDSHDKRFDRMEEMLRQVLARLPEKGE